MEAEKNEMGKNPPFGTDLNKLVRSVGPAAFDGIHILSPPEPEQARNTCAGRANPDGGVRETVQITNRGELTNRQGGKTYDV